ncbi:transglycosylase SLT domain-containing protein [Salinispirillum sp. LH 10-3-1]|uniref:Transglycosylase SLT domain-containing protein n=1 Tax=Salinispirillum sp. LH 10-3-1 TaxID=2952525 RepID=A0AB38YJZ5_9GAMM
MASASLAQSFESFQAQQQQGFAQFQQDLDEGQQAYRDAFEREMQRYQNELSQFWRNPQLSTNTRWVEYRDGNQIRTIVDYERNEIIIEVPAEQGVEKGLDVLSDLLTKDLGSARADDVVEQRTQQALGQRDASRASDDQQRVLSEVAPQEVPGMLEQATAERRNERSETGASRPVIAITVPLPASRTSDKAREYLPLVQRYAQRYQLEPALVLAIMHSESSFNPMARSHIPAYGLMQIVPGSAGKDVAEVLYGEQKLLSSDYLYQAENNVRAGSVYLNILDQRYLRGIEHPESRLYAVIAAYNTGAGNVARAFVGSNNISAAIQRINQMSPRDVYRTLQRDLPYQETRDYLEKVTARQAAYRSF